LRCLVHYLKKTKGAGATVIKALVAACALWGLVVLLGALHMCYQGYKRDLAIAQVNYNAAVLSCLLKCNPPDIAPGTSIGPADEPMPR